MIIADMDCGLTHVVVGGIVRDYLHENATQSIHRQVLGKDWWQRFLKRWPCISEQKHFMCMQGSSISAQRLSTTTAAVFLSRLHRYANVFGNSCLMGYLQLNKYEGKAVCSARSSDAQICNVAVWYL